MKDRIRQAPEEAQGNTEEAAKRLNMKEAALVRKLKKWGIQVATS